MIRRGINHYTGNKIVMQTSVIDQKSDEYYVVMCTCPDQASADAVAHILVDQQLAACVNIIPAVASVYRWQGKIEKNSELLLLIKTKRIALAGIETAIINHHPYELPEIISIPIHSGLTHYLSWIDDTVVTI